MKSFELSKNLDKNKVFLVNWSELNGRVDPSWYSYLRGIKKSSYKQVFLKSLCHDIKNGSTPSGGVFEKSGIPYFRSQDFDLFDVQINQYVTQEFHELISRSKVRPNDVLLAVVGATLGKVGLVSDLIKEANINQNVARISIRETEKILPKFLAIFLSSKLGQNQIFQNATITTQAYLNNKQLGNLLIPIPPKQIQEKIVRMMDEAYSLKKQNEAKAEELLASIDDYLMKELGIELSPEQENTLESRMFFTSLNEVSGSRLDSFYHIPSLRILEEEVISKSSKKLRDYVVSLSGGATPKRDEEQNYSDEVNGVPFLRVQNITEQGLDLSDVKYISQEIHEKELARSKVFEDDLLITITGRIGSAAVAPKGFVGNINQHSVVIKTESRGVSEYLAAYLNSNIVRKIALRKTTGGTRPALDYKALLSIPVPYLSGSKQKEVVAFITNIRKQAQELKDQAKSALEQANRKIEEILLGS